MSDFPWQDAWDDLYAKGMHELGMSEPDAQVYADRHADAELEKRQAPKPETTICAKCQNLHNDAKRDPHWRWLCTAAPIETINPVCGYVDPPYRFCSTINKGACWMYREGPNALNPKESADA